MASLLFASKIGAKILAGATIAKAVPIVVPVACAAACMGITIAGAKYLSKKFQAKKFARGSKCTCKKARGRRKRSKHKCDYVKGYYADEPSTNKTEQHDILISPPIPICGL